MFTKENTHLDLIILLSFLFCLSPLGLMADDDISEADTLYTQGGMKNYKRSIELYLKALKAKALLEKVAQSDETYFCDWANRLLLDIK